MEARFKNGWTSMSVVYNDVQKGQYTARNTQLFKMYAVTIKIWLNITIEFYHYSLWGEMSMVFPVTCIFSLFEACFWSAMFSGLHFYTLSQTLIPCRAMQLRVETCTPFTRCPSSRVEPARRVRLAFFSSCNHNFLAPRAGSDPPFLPRRNSRIRPASWGRHGNFMYV